MTARVMLAALFALLLSGCGGATRVCFEWDMPGYCKVPPPPTTTLTVQNACAYPVAIGADGSAVEPATTCTRDAQCGTAQRCEVRGAKGACVWTLPAPTSGGELLQPEEAATFRLPRDPDRAQGWSGVVFPKTGDRPSGAELSLRPDAAAGYALHAGAAGVPVAMQPAGCAAADAEHPGPFECRDASADYVVTFCAPSGSGK